MIKRLLDRIKSPPANHVDYRSLFGVLIAVFVIFLVIDAVQWAYGRAQPRQSIISEIGMLLMGLFFFSRQPYVRLASYFSGMALLTISIVTRFT
jgi:hypothetical protein